MTWGTVGKLTLLAGSLLLGILMGLLIFAWTLIAAGISGRAGVTRGSRGVSPK
jgi:hypothetical protein